MKSITIVDGEESHPAVVYGFAEWPGMAEGDHLIDMDPDRRVYRRASDGVLVIVSDALNDHD